MHKKLTISIALLAVLCFAAVGFAGEQYRTSVAKTVSVAGDSVVVFSAKSGLQTVIDGGTLVDEDDADSGLYVYYGSGNTLTALANEAVTATGVSMSTTSSSAPARTGDIIYEITRADEPSDTSFIFHGQVSGITFSDTANTMYVTRAASNSEAIINTGDTIHIGIPLIGTRGTGPTQILPYVVTDDGAVVYFSSNANAAAYSTLFNALETGAVFPVGKYGRDYIVRWDTGGAIVDGETKLLNGHYEPKK